MAFGIRRSLLASGDETMELPPELDAAAQASAAPGSVRLAFEQLLGAADSAPGVAERLVADPRLASSAAAVVSASRSLTRVILTDTSALDVLSAVSDGELRTAGGVADPSQASDPHDLVRRKRLGMLAIAAADLTGAIGLEEAGAALSGLADAVLRAACSLSGGHEGLAIIAMGKLGAGELNYASDVDLMFVGEDPEGAGRRILATAAAAFRVDTDLRPEGRNGALVRSLDSFRSYWDRWARPWEFQALLKARYAAGDAQLGAEFEKAGGDAVWGRALGADDLAELRAMKGRAEELIERKGLEAREIKRGRGGIRDIEFSVQLLQLVHGAGDPAIRQPATLPALAELGSAGYIDSRDASALAIAYRFLRTLEHRLQLVEEAQVHTVPESLEARRALARVLGFAAPPGPPSTQKGRGATHLRGGGEPEDRLAAVLARHQSHARAIHERLFFRPLLEVFAARDVTSTATSTSSRGTSRWTVTAAEDRLSALGFRQAERTREALSELTRGLTRSSRLMQQLLPVLLGWLSETPDPDEGLLSLRRLVSAHHSRDVLVAGFRESPELARRLALLLGTSRQVGGLVARHPELAVTFADDAGLVGEPADDLRATAIRAADPGTGRAEPALRHLVESVTLRIIATDILSQATDAEISRALADLGDATIAAALGAARPSVPMGLVAMGRLGGKELSYGSDLDVLLVYDGSGADDAAAAEEAAAAIFRLLNGSTPAERVWTIDASLRPEGRQGPLARSLEAYAEYYERWAAIWELQALVRARPVAGDPIVLDKFMGLVDQHVWGRSFGPEETRTIRLMKARTERERIPAGEDPQFHLKLGKGSLADVEWTAQLLQLQSRTPATGTLDALRLLMAAGCLEVVEGAVLAEAFRFCSATRNRWHLVGNFVAGEGRIVSKVGSDSLPSDREALGRLARSLGSDPTELREAYRRVTRRARRIVEARFYGL